MEHITALNPDRLAWCLRDRGISVTECAMELGIAEDSLQAVLAGNGSLTPNQLRKIADYFNRSILFFVDPDPINATTLHSAQFRTLANQKPDLSPAIKALIERVERQRDVYLSLREDLDFEDQVHFSPPAFEGKSPAAAAKFARDWLGLGQENDFERYRKAIEAKGILVFRSNGYAGKWKVPKESAVLGFSLYHPQCPLIFVKKQHADAPESFTLFHELAHLLLHRMSVIDDDAQMLAETKIEQQANAFAGHLLVPDAFLTLISDSKRPAAVSEFDEWLAPQRKAWGVSAEVILRRLLDSKRLPHPHYLAYRAWRNSLPAPEPGDGGMRWRDREPIHIFGDGYVRTVLDALNTQQISLVKASDHLDGLKIATMHKLEAFYADA
jgi:Zn-dependent peptidase ImmA (M78 family)